MSSDDDALDVDVEVTRRLASFGKQLLDEAGTGDHQVPIDPIHHYTTASGLDGILRTRRLWATNTDYLNDTSELSYGRRMALEIMRARHSELNKDILPVSIETILSTPDKLLADAPIEKLAPWALLSGLWRSLREVKEREYYVASLCKSGDLLSQWRGYGNQGGGYSIGFRVKESIFTMKKNHNFQLLKLVYDKANQRSLLEQLIDGILQELQACLPLIKSKGNLTERNPYFAAIVHAANYMLRVFTLRFKASGFAEENEWRFSSAMLPDQVNGVKFRDVKGVLTPYLELDIDVPEIEIVSITCGPTLHPELSARSVQMLLAQYNMQHVEVTTSTIPFKS